MKCRVFLPSLSSPPPEKEVTWESENSQVPNYPMNRTLSSPGTNLTSSPEDRENIADLLYFVKRNNKI